MCYGKRYEMVREMLLLLLLMRSTAALETEGRAEQAEETFPSTATDI